MGDLLRKAHDEVTGVRGDAAANDSNGKPMACRSRMVEAAGLMARAADSRLQSSFLCAADLLREKAAELERVAGGDHGRVDKVRRLVSISGNLGHQLSLEVSKAVSALADHHGSETAILRCTDAAEAADAAAYEAMSNAVNGVCA